MDKFRQFYTENRERLFGYLLRKSGNVSLAADLAQESFTRYLERYRNHELSVALLFTIGRNIFYDHVRRQPRQIALAESPPDLADDQERLYIVREESRRVLAALQEPMIELLKHQPEFSIDRLQFRNQHGEALLTGALKLDGAKPEDFANPMLLMGKVNMQADLKLPAAMAVSFMTAGKPAAEEDEAQAAARTNMALQQVDAFVAQGYLERQGELVQARFALSKGAMTLNDKPFGPGAH